MAKRVKKDFDKDQMDRKIMPSAGTAVLEVKPAPEEAEAGEYPQQPHNFMEDMVWSKMEHTLKVLDGCGCERCRQDIAAIALNELPTLYAVADQNDAYYLKKLRGAYEVKVTAALIRAVQQVKKSPRH